MLILLGWMWGPYNDDRNLAVVANGFEQWNARPVANSELPWPMLGHFVADDVPSSSLTRFDLEPLVETLLGRLRSTQFDIGGKIFMTLITDETGAGLAVQLEVVASYLDALTPALGAAFADHDLVLYSPGDDVLHSRGAIDTSLLSGPSGHHWQPAWNDITSELHRLADCTVLLFEDERGDFIRVSGRKAAFTIESCVAGEHAIAGRDGREVLTLHDAVQLLKSYYEDRELSPWFSWRPTAD